MFVIQYNRDKYSLDKIYEIGEAVRSICPNDDFIFLPDGVSLMQLEKEELKEILQLAQNWVEKN